MRNISSNNKGICAIPAVWRINCVSPLIQPHGCKSTNREHKIRASSRRGSIREKPYMADDVTIRFSADTDDLEDGLANVRGAVGSVTPDLKKLSESVSDAAQKTAPATTAFSRMSVAIGDGLTGALRPASAALGRARRRRRRRQDEHRRRDQGAARVAGDQEDDLRRRGEAQEHQRGRKNRVREGRDAGGIRGATRLAGAGGGARRSKRQAEGVRR